MNRVCIAFGLLVATALHASAAEVQLDGHTGGFRRGLPDQS
jgi:hypothetical protein